MTRLKRTAAEMGAAARERTEETETAELIAMVDGRDIRET